MSPLTRTALVATVVALTSAVLPPAAGASVEGEFRDLAERRLSPAPLVPTLAAPAALDPLDASIGPAPSQSRSSYAFRLRGASRPQGGIDTVVDFEGSRYKSLGAAVRSFRARGYKIRPARVDGRKGYRLTFARERIVLSAQHGVVFTVGSGTPRTVSFADLHKVAASVDQLGGAFTGVVEDPDREVIGEAFVVTTRRTFIADVSWTAECTAPDGFYRTPQAWTARVVFLPRPGGNFAFDLPDAELGDDALPWQGSVAGHVDAGGGTLNLRATTARNGETCDTGPLSLKLEPNR